MASAIDYSEIIGTRYKLSDIQDADVIILHCLAHQLDARAAAGFRASRRGT